MATFLYKTRGNSSPERKPRVYFTCHPDDFSKHFEKICSDIFATHDSAIFYTESMTEEIEEKYKESDLGQMNLFVIPVTFKLLIQPNRAMDSDFRYAQEKHIPVLPIMMETGLDSFYSAKDKFGEAQYLSPYVQDLTAISYEEKLKKYLESVLISNEMAERIRKAFDAYIFLSYRKKDRHYANELMKLIHSHPEFRDIAIWYDEFLTPGESFRANIEKMMKDSKLFTLLVTPNLLEYVDGQPNYVMAHEYPDAKKAGMDILPTEMEQTDKVELCSNFTEIPECVDPKENELFKSRLLDSLSKIAISANNADPEHNFLIGLAYLDGIDVETNKERAIELITMAAEANLFEAMEMLQNMYSEGKNIQINYQKALLWSERMFSYCKEKLGEENEDTLIALNKLAITHMKIGNYQKAAELLETAYAFRCKILGEEHPSSLTSLGNLALTYGDLGNYTKALELQKRIYSIECKTLGESHQSTLTTLSNLAVTYDKIGDYHHALELQEKCYGIQCKILGEEHPNTLSMLNNLASYYGNLGDYTKKSELGKKSYVLHCKIFGEEHPDTLKTLGNIALTYIHLGEYPKALELNEKVLALRSKILGEEHPDTLTALSNLASTYSESGDYEKALSTQEKVYDLLCKTMGENHPDTLIALGNLAATHIDFGNHEKALKLNNHVYEQMRKKLGEEHPDTLNALNNLAVAYHHAEHYRKAIELEEIVYICQCKVFGEKHQALLPTLNTIALSYDKLGQYEKALEWDEKIYALRCKLFGEDHPDTLVALSNLAEIHNKRGDSAKADALFEKMFKSFLKKTLMENNPEALPMLSLFSSDPEN